MQANNFSKVRPYRNFAHSIAKKYNGKVSEIPSKSPDVPPHFRVDY